MFFFESNEIYFVLEGNSKFIVELLTNGKCHLVLLGKIRDFIFQFCTKVIHHFRLAA
jgi:hypothetical protein